MDGFGFNWEIYLLDLPRVSGNQKIEEIFRWIVYHVGNPSMSPIQSSFSVISLIRASYGDTNLVARNPKT